MGNFFFFDEDTNETKELPENKVLLYTTDENDVHISVACYDESFWLTQKSMAELFGVQIATINEHLKNIYDDGELEENPTIRNFRIVQTEGNRTVRRSVGLLKKKSLLSIKHLFFNFRLSKKSGTLYLYSLYFPHLQVSH